ncbi:MAG: TonB-dependent receptor [Bacteroidia bacterium]|nr:TonB-dependent receptor [Bacteroidia bacterium]
MKKFLFSPVVWLLILAGTQTLHAQSGLEVRLTDFTTRQPVTGQLIRLANPELGYTTTATTNAQGKVIFSGLSAAGTYSVTADQSDIYLPSSDTIRLRENYTASLDLLLFAKKEYELDEIIIAGGGATQINAVNAEVSSTLSREEVRTLPVEGRDITRLLYRLPNVSQATGFYPEAPNVAINGANSLYTNYMIDGMDNNERFLGGQKFAIPVGFVQNVTVLTNNFSAEFGNTGNGVINISSRSGSNTFSGEAFFITRPGPVIDGSSPYAQRDLSGNQVKDGFQRYQAGFAIGGALKANKTFYYLNAEQTLDLKDNLLTVPQLGINETVRGQNNFTYLSAKLDQHWSNRFRSSLRVNQGLVAIERQGGGLDGGVTFPSAANSQDRNSTLVALRNTYTGNRLIFESHYQYSRFRWNYGRAANPTSPQTVVQGPDNLTLAVLGHPGYVFDATENTFQTQQKATFLLGNHTVKAGLELISADHLLAGGGNPNGNYTVKLTQSQVEGLRSVGSALTVTDIPADAEVLNYNIELRPNTFGTRQQVFSAYVEDQFSVSSRLNVNLGLRYDYDNLSKGGNTQGDLNNIAPRVSFNTRVNSKSTLRGGYGMFYDKILYAIYSDALQQNTTSADYRAQLQELVRVGQLPANTDIEAITFDGNLSASLSSVTYLQGPGAASLQEQRAAAFSGERRILNPNGYQNPVTHQMTLGFQHQVNKEVLFYVDVMHNRSYNLFRLRNINSVSAYPVTDPANVVVRTTTEADLTRPVPIYGNYAVIGGDTLTGVARNVVMTESGGESRYWAASFNLQKERGDDNYAFRLIYTLSRLENNTEDINFRAQDANNFEAEWGPSINDRTHILNGIVTWYAADHLTFSLASLMQSGQPINRIPDGLRYGTTDLNGDGQSFGDAYVGNSDRHPGESRNSDRLPWATTFDLGAQYDLPLGESRLAVRADVFNLFNAANLSGYSNNATQSNQIQVGSVASGLLVRRNASAPRQFQFGVTYLF